MKRVTMIFKPMKYLKPMSLAPKALLVLPLMISTVNANTLNSAISTQQQTDKSSISSQAKVDKLADQTSDLLADYKQTLRQTESLRVYNDQLEKMVTSQREEVQSINDQIATIDQTNIDITPLMLKMVDSLEQFISLDIPFLIDERMERIEKLKATMDRADVTTSEKYRKILEAYQIENEFGRTSEAYKASLGEGDDTRNYNFLRIGRTALMYQSLDGTETGHWNKESRQFENLDPSYASAVKTGLKIARKQAPPALITLPISAAEDVK